MWGLGPRVQCLWLAVEGFGLHSFVPSRLDWVYEFACGLVGTFVTITLALRIQVGPCFLLRSPARDQSPRPPS